MEGIGKAIECLLWIAGLAVAFVIGLFMSLGIYIWLNHEPVVRSTHPIQPSIELEINNNQVDTIYIYREQE